MEKVPFKVKALYEYKSEHEDDLNFAPGTIITVTEVEDDEWYSGFHGAESGMFPKNFVEPVKEDPPAPTIAKQSEPAPVPVVPQETSAPPTSEPKEPIASSPPVAKEESSKVPKPTVFPGPGLQRDDPYAVKKLFAGAGKSSYVPQVKPRDQANIVGHAHHDVAKGAEVVREHDKQLDEEEADEPKVSLKDRIAMLQKRQQEEAEREAAALKRKEERKKKLEEEKERLKHQKESQAALLSATSTGASLGQASEHDGDDTESLAESVPPVPGHIPPEAAPSIPEEYEEQETPVEEEREEEDEDDNEEDEEDEEELKRRRLVERMAKISGGRNMFGMMGMPTPFGAPAASSSSKPKKSKAKPQEDEAEVPAVPQRVEKTQTGESIPQVPGAVPIPGMAQPGSSPVKQPQEKPVNNATASLKKPTQEDSSIAESDYTDEQIVPVTNENKGFEQVEENKPKSPTLELSESEPEQNERDDDMDLGPRSTWEGEVTGYEADEDVSDRGAISKTELPETDHPKLPAKQAVPPPIPGGPPPGEAPAAPEIPSGQPPVPKSPNRSKAPPPIPSAAPPSEPPASSAPLIPPPVPLEAPLPPVERPEVPSSDPPVPSRPPPTPRDAPAPPTTKLPPPPPIPSGPPPVQAPEVEEDSSEDENEFRDLPPQPAKAPERVLTFSHPPPIPQAPITRANTTESSRRSFESHKRKSSDLSRSRSVGKSEQLQADINLPVLQDEINNLAESSGWWIKDAVPDCLEGSVGTDFIFEVDRHKSNKRGGREVVYKDYYILFHDLSQIVVELQYDSDDPRTTLSVCNAYVKSPIMNRRDVLDKYHALFGPAVVDAAQSLANSRVSNGFVNTVFKHVNHAYKDVLLSPIGNKAFGVTVYKNQNGTSVKYDDIKAGDILCMKNAKFTTHGLGGLSTKTAVYGEGNHFYSGVIVEIDHKKDKLRVLDSDDSGAVKKESFKINDLKSGRLRVFRFVDRQFVGW